jgi:hypothetical protein
MSTALSTTTRSSLVPAAALSLAISALLLASASWGDGSENNPTRRFAITLAVAIVCTVPVFGWAVPRARRTPGGSTAIVLAVLALLSMAVYWVGLTPVLGAGAIVAGWGDHQRNAALQRTAVVLGALAVTAFAALSLLELIR